MADFAPSTSASQSANGLAVTFLDESNYGINDQEYVKSDFTVNTIVIKDANGAILQTSDFLTSDTVTYNQTEDHWFTIERTLAGAAPYTKTEKFGLKRITINKLEQALSSGCCNKNPANLCEANAFINGANYALPSGNAVKWQKNIDTANTFLDLING